MTALVAICAFSWAAPTGPVDGYYVLRNGRPVTTVRTPHAELYVGWGDRISVAAYNVERREVGPESRPWQGEHWGRCRDA